MNVTKIMNKMNLLFWPSWFFFLILKQETAENILRKQNFIDGYWLVEEP